MRACLILVGFLAASPGVLAQEAVEDVAPRSLWITVRQATSRSSSDTSAVVTGGVPLGGGGVQVTQDGATVTTRRTRTVVTGGFGAGSNAETGSDVQRLQALEGRPAFIQAGEVRPVPTVAVVPAPGGTSVVSGNAYVEASTGFWVLPRLSGTIVTLEIATAKDAFTAGAAVDRRHTSTTLSGRLGEWIHVGGIGGESASHTTGIGSVASGSSTSGWNVDLRVEALPVP